MAFPRLHPETIRDTIARIASERGLSGYKLAKLADIGETTVYRYLRGECDMTGATLDRLLHGLGLEIGESRKGKCNGKVKAR